MPLRIFLLSCSIALALGAAEKYSGPLPPKTDVLYLLQANRLIETEAGQAREESKKNESTYTIAGASSPARTPLSEPILIVDARQLAPERMELYKLDVRNGNREISLSTKSRKGGPRPLHLMVTKIQDRLYRVEADEPLENGEYAITPSGDNRVFCFQIY
ncbi:MAG TPA: hypothetical protein VEU96_18790 [Bryobacteraceae bacterium]|nr:hypothetical protein [Bryobacteraceae bacterium]